MTRLIHQDYFFTPEENALESKKWSSFIKVSARRLDFGIWSERYLINLIGGDECDLMQDDSKITMGMFFPVALYLAKTWSKFNSQEAFS